MGIVVSSFPAVRGALGQADAYGIGRRGGRVLQERHAFRMFRRMGLLHHCHSRHDGGPLSVSSHASTALVRAIFFFFFFN